MGGVSTADGKVENGYLIFDGNLSLENNGGFTSIRRQMTDDLTDYSGIRLRLRGDGRSYYFRLAELAGGREVSHEILFQTVADSWIDVELPFDQYVPNFRGFPIDQPPANRSNLRDINFMLREKNPGYFRLEIAKVEAYR